VVLVDNTLITLKKSGYNVLETFVILNHAKRWSSPACKLYANLNIKRF